MSAVAQIGKQWYSPQVWLHRTVLKHGFFQPINYGMPK